MNINLPTNPETRARLGDIDAIVETLAPENRSRIPSYVAAERQAAGFLSQEPAAESIDIICRNADGSIDLREFRRDCPGITIWCFTSGDGDQPSPPAPKHRSTPYERTRAAVYATGNKWAIENFNATH